MKKSVKVILALAVIAIALTITYHAVNRIPAPELTAEMRVKAIFDDGGCLDCHSATPNLPFYASLPVAGDIVKKDVSEALKHTDLTEAYRALSDGRPVGEVTLSKIEKSVADGSMPMAKYYLVHWGSSLTNAKKEILLDWVKKHRAEHYPNNLSATVFANEPIQPIADSIPVDIRKVALGEMLYNDPRLSSDNTVSCASCHNLQTGGVDNKAYSEGVGKQLGGVNAPTVFNAVYNFVQFWDGRAADLKEQAAGPPLNPVEMGSASFDEICAKLAEDKELSKRFLEVFPEGFTQSTVTEAIAEFEKTLLTPSRFDKYLQGDKNALTAEELEGYQLFKDNKCATCHVGMNLGGQSYEYMGIKDNYFDYRGTGLTDGDNGRWAVTKNEADRHKFKTPTLRNVMLTTPYMHDGSITTIEDAIQVMHEFQIGKRISDAETAKIVAFLGTLTGEYNGELLQ